MMDKLEIKHKSVTNKWGIIKKKLWGLEVARAAGEKTRLAGNMAFTKRKRELEAEEEARNPRPVKEKPRFYDVQTEYANGEVDGGLEGVSPAMPPVSGTLTGQVGEGSVSVEEGGTSYGTPDEGGVDEGTGNDGRANGGTNNENGSL